MKKRSCIRFMSKIWCKVIYMQVLFAECFFLNGHQQCRYGGTCEQSFMQGGGGGWEHGFFPLQDTVFPQEFILIIISININGKTINTLQTYLPIFFP